MLLKDAKIGRAYTVKSIHLPFQLERRLEALGMTRQTAISVLNRKGKGILIIKLRGTRFALGYSITKILQWKKVTCMSEQEMTIGFIGNPNCGKTTLFNAYTGANLKVANWPGVTVEKVEGVMKDHDLTIHLVDLPGTYSLTSYTMEETVSRQFILSDEVDVIINVADASALERSLYLTLQLLELGKPVVLALNMMDIVEKRGMEIDLDRLPEYKLPDSRTVAIYVWEKVKDYLEKAGTTIFIATLVIWLLLNFGPHGYSPDMAQSFGAMIGKCLVPFFAPIGLDFWQIAVALIAGVSAKEVVVSSCAVLFGIVNASSPDGMSAFASALNGIGFGPLNAFCLMVFCLLYIPCAAALATIRKESGSWAWMGFTAIFQLLVAWIVTFVVYQIGFL